MPNAEIKAGFLAEAFKRGLAGETLTPPLEWYKAPTGTHARLLPLAGLRLDSPPIPGQTRIFIDKEKNPGGCKGGVCLIVYYQEFLPDDNIKLLNIHLNGNDEIRPDGLALGLVGRGSKDFGYILQALDDHLVELGLLQPQDENKSKR